MVGKTLAGQSPRGSTDFGKLSRSELTEVQWRPNATVPRTLVGDHDTRTGLRVPGKQNRVHMKRRHSTFQVAKQNVPFVPTQCQEPLVFAKADWIGLTDDLRYGIEIFFGDSWSHVIDFRHEPFRSAAEFVEKVSSGVPAAAKRLQNLAAA